MLQGSRTRPILSVVAPAFNEEDVLDAFHLDLTRTLETIESEYPFEIIYVNDGSTDATGERLAAEMQKRGNLRQIRHEASSGQSAAVRTGVRAARGKIVATLDGDGQNNPAFLVNLIEAIEKGGEKVGLAAGQRVGRKDTGFKRFQSRAANGVRNAILHDGTRDTGCGLKLIRRDVFRGLPYFDHMHRYLPALVARDGWRTLHVDVAHAPRHAGRSNYANLSRALVGAYDLVGVVWLIRRRKKARGVEATPGAGA